MHYDTKIYREIIMTRPRTGLLYCVPKQGTCPVTGLWNRGLLKILNDSKLSDPLDLVRL